MLQQILPPTSVGNLIIGTTSETLNFDIGVVNRISAEIQLIHAVVKRTYKWSIQMVYFGSSIGYLLKNGHR